MKGNHITHITINTMSVVVVSDLIVL